MPIADLDYTLENLNYRYTADENTLVESADTTKPAKEWGEPKYDSLKERLKHSYVLEQKDRCGVCRCRLRPRGRFDHIEHIVGKKLKPRWMFQPKNLVILCPECNVGKGKEITLSQGYTSAEYPDHENHFLVFQPHFDTWSDHFEIENEFFLRAKSDRGTTTVKAYKLSRYELCVMYFQEQNWAHEDSAKAILHKRKDLAEDSNEYVRLTEALNYYLERIPPAKHAEVLLRPNDQEVAR